MDESTATRVANPSLSSEVNCCIAVRVNAGENVDEAGGLSTKIILELDGCISV